MRVTCPHCGERDRREFTWGGDAVALSRPDPGADPDEWHHYLHIRDNPAGPTRDLWYHDPCGTWLVVHRDTLTHAVHSTEPAESAAR